MSETMSVLDEPVLRRPRIVRWFAARPRIADVFVILVCTAPTAAALIISPPAHAWLGYVCAGGVAVAFWWRRSHPLVVLIVVVALPALNPVSGANALPSFVEGFFGLYALAAHARLRTAIFGFFLSEVVIFLASDAAVLLGFREDVATIALRPTSLVAIALGVAVRANQSRRTAIEELVALREDRAAASERSRIAAEMHDVVAHSVTVMVALAGGAAVAWERHPERARNALDQLGTVGAHTLEEMQRILRLLREHDGDLDRNLESSGHNLPSLEELAEVFRTAGLPVELTITAAKLSGEAANPDPALQTTVYRIVQEALTNTLRHARDVTRVEVEVVEGEDLITVTISDDGRGTKPGPSMGAGLGLRAMRERAAAFHGEFEAGPLPTAGLDSGSGWRTRVSIPRDERSR